MGISLNKKVEQILHSTTWLFLSIEIPILPLTGLNSSEQLCASFHSGETDKGVVPQLFPTVSPSAYTLAHSWSRKLSDLVRYTPIAFTTCLTTVLMIALGFFFLLSILSTFYNFSQREALSSSSYPFISNSRTQI